MTEESREHIVALESELQKAQDQNVQPQLLKTVTNYESAVCGLVTRLMGSEHCLVESEGDSEVQGLAALQSNIDTLCGKMSELQSALTAADLEYATLKTNQEDVHRHDEELVATLDLERAEWAAEDRRHRDTIVSLETTLDEIKSQNLELQRSVEDLEVNIGAERKDVESVSTELGEVRVKFTECSVELDTAHAVRMRPIGGSVGGIRSRELQS